MKQSQTAKNRDSLSRQFAEKTTGAVAVEFALIALPFLATLLVIMEEGLDLYMKSAIEHATTEAARSIFTGAAQNMTLNGAALTQQTFIQNVVCPNLPSSLSCSNVFVNVVSFQQSYAAGATPYYTFLNTAKTAIAPPQLDNAKNSFCLGSGSAYVVLQVSYPLPVITDLLGSAKLATYNGRTVRVISYTAAFRNEPFPTPASSQC